MVNVVGSFVIGVLMTAFEERFTAAPGLRVFLTIGILGGFTTFASFSYETMALVREGDLLAGGANLAATVVTCLGTTWVGMIIGRYV